MQPNKYQPNHHFKFKRCMKQKCNVDFQFGFEQKNPQKNLVEVVFFSSRLIFQQKHETNSMKIRRWINFPENFDEDGKYFDGGLAKILTKESPWEQYLNKTTCGNNIKIDMAHWICR